MQNGHRKPRVFLNLKAKMKQVTQTLDFRSDFSVNLQTQGNDISTVRKLLRLPILRTCVELRKSWAAKRK